MHASSYSYAHSAEDSSEEDLSDTEQEAQEVKEPSGIVSLDESQQEIYQNEMRIIFDRLFPEHDWDSLPIEFALVDSDTVNAFFLKSDSKVRIGFTRGLILDETEDLLASIMSHEYGHLQNRLKYGDIQSSKADEILSDVAPLERVEVAGYDATVALEKFIQHHTNESIEIVLIKSFFDPHPSNPMRIQILESALARLSILRGGLNKDKGIQRRPISDTLQDLVLDISIESVKDHSLSSGDENNIYEYLHNGYEKHKHVLQAFLFLEEFPELYKKAVAENEDTQKLLMQCSNCLDNFRRTPMNEEDTKELHSFCELISEFIWSEDVKIDVSRIKASRLVSTDVDEALRVRKEGEKPIKEIFLQIIQHARELYPNTSPFGRVQTQIDTFARSKEIDELSAIAAEINDWYEAHVSKLINLFEDPSKLNSPFHFLRLPGKATHYDDGAIPFQLSPWEEHIQAAIISPHNSITFALIRLGVHDKRLYDRLTDDEFITVANESFRLAAPHIVKRYESGEDEDGRGFVYHLDDNGKVSELTEIRARVDHHRMGMSLLSRDRTPLIAENLFARAAQGDKEAENSLSSLSLVMPFDQLIGVDNLLEDPALFIKLNRDLLSSTFSSKETLIAAEENRLTILSKLEELAADPTQRENVRCFFLEHFNESIFFDKDHVGKDYHNEDLLEFSYFVLDDPYSLFTQDEKVRYLTQIEAFPTYDIVDDYTREKLRKLFDSPEVSNIEELKKTVRRLSEMRKDEDEESEYIPSEALLVYEVEHFLALHPDNHAVKIEELLDLIPEQALSDNKELRRAITLNIERRKVWPEKPGEIISVCKALSKARLFPEDSPLEEELLEKATSKIREESDLQKRQGMIEALLVSSASEWPRIRTFLIQEWIATSVNMTEGKTESERQQLLLKFTDELLPKLNYRDKYDICQKLAETVQAQRELSFALEERTTSLTKEQLDNSQHIGAALESIMLVSQRDAKLRDSLISFLLERPTDERCSKVQEQITRSIKMQSDVPNTPEIRSALEQLEKIFVKKPRRLYLRELNKIHQNFWSAPMEARAVIMKQLLFPYNKDENIREMIFYGGFQYVLDQLFPADAKYATEARKILIRYADCLSDIERSIFIAAAMAAVEKGREQSEHSIGRRLAFILELLGPAEIKLGQAIHSFDKTPADIRADMTLMKQDINIPARWDAWKNIDATAPEHLRKRIVHVGERLGSASYYYVYRVTLDDGKDYALAVLKENALDRSLAGFSKIQKLLAALEEDGSLPEILSSFRDIVQQASDMAAIETDHVKGKLQAQSAEEMYDEINILADGETMIFDAIHTYESGEGYRLMELAEGEHFNDLVKSGKAEIPLKTLGLSYNFLELCNIFGGGWFDEDRHGGQLRILKRRAKLFDFGALRLTKATDQELQALGRVLYQMYRDLSKEGENDTAISDRMSDYFLNAISTYKSSGQANTGYLVSVQKAWLALNDFRSDFSTQDYIDVLQAVFAQNRIPMHPAIIQGFQEQMTLTEQMGFSLLRKKKARVSFV